MIMRKFLAALLSALGFGAGAEKKVAEMTRFFAPRGEFSVMAPANWVAAADRFNVTAPNNGPSLSGMVYRVDRRPGLKEFADSWFEGVNKMGIYKQVGEDRATENASGVFREYEGVWPSDTFVTYNVVAFRNAGRNYACVQLVTSKSDYIKNRSFYEKLLSTFEMHQ